MVGVFSRGYDTWTNACVVNIFLVFTICLYPQLQWMRLETLLSPMSVALVTWRWSRLSLTSMLIQIVSVYQCCGYVVDGGLPQSQSTRLVTPHSLWPTNVDTGKWSSISPSLITVIQKVKFVRGCQWMTCWFYRTIKLRFIIDTVYSCKFGSIIGSF